MAGRRKESKRRYEKESGERTFYLAQSTERLPGNAKTIIALSFMRTFLTRTFERDYKKLPKEIQKQCDKQLFILLKNPHHPSLQTSKIHGVQNIWEGRVTEAYRFTFAIIQDTYIIRRVGKHDKTLENP